VWPRGAQVERTIGVSEIPDSSKKQMTAPRRLAFFYPRPVAGDPLADRLLVALPGAAGGALQRPAELVAQQLPDVGGVVTHPGGAPDDFCDAAKGPQVGVEAVGLGALQQRLLDSVQLRWGQLGRAAGRANAGKAVGAVGLPALVPAADGLAGDAQGAGHLGLVDALLEELGGVQAAALKGVAVPAFGDGFAITGCHGLMLPPTPALCHCRSQKSLKRKLSLDSRCGN
jgi:hypothetical protein